MKAKSDKDIELTYLWGISHQAYFLLDIYILRKGTSIINIILVIGTEGTTNGIDI